MEYRRDDTTEEHKFDPTSTLNIRIETIEELSKKVEVVGYCGLNIFCKPNSKDPPDNPTQTEFVLNKGAHQIPVYVMKHVFFFFLVLFIFTFIYILLLTLFKNNNF